MKTIKTNFHSRVTFLLSGCYFHYYGRLGLRPAHLCSFLQLSSSSHPSRDFFRILSLPHTSLSSHPRMLSLLIQASSRVSLFFWWFGSLAAWQSSFGSSFSDSWIWLTELWLRASTSRQDKGVFITTLEQISDSKRLNEADLIALSSLLRRELTAKPVEFCFPYRPYLTLPSLFVLCIICVSLN